MSDDMGLEHYWRCGCGELNPPARTDCGNCGSDSVTRTDPIFSKKSGEPPMTDPVKLLTMSAELYKDIRQVNSYAHVNGLNDLFDGMFEENPITALLAEVDAQDAEVARVQGVLAGMREWLQTRRAIVDGEGGGGVAPFTGYSYDMEFTIGLHELDGALAELARLATPVTEGK